MIDADVFRNLRAGPVFKAGRINDATIRGWIANYGLELGDRAEREAGRPLYDLADCARVFMLHILTKKIHMEAEPAVWIVNKAHTHIAHIAAKELAAIGTGEAPDCPRYELTMPAMSLDVTTNPEIRLHSSPAAVADRNASRGRWCEIVMDLREIVRHARNELANVQGFSTSGLRHDFADAVDPQYDKPA